jgi:hypothetical protein
MSFKQKIYLAYQEVIHNKIAALQQHLAGLAESLKQETKSTAGDKYETSRAMIHIEQENAGRQLKELQEQKAMLDSIDIEHAPVSIEKGSLIKTDKGYLFMSIALGKISLEGEHIFALSPASPLGGLLMGLKAGAQVTIHKTTYTVETIT